MVAVQGFAGARPEAALRESDARFRTLVSNVPGMVFTLLASGRGVPTFQYVSEGCQAVLGMPAERLQQDPKAFIELILPEDRDSFRYSMRFASERATWNWEGRIRPPGTAQIKWINLRASARAQEQARVWDGVVYNITQSKVYALELQRAHQQLMELSEHTERVKEEERARIAREIHDELGGTLTAIKIELVQLEKRLPAGSQAARRHTRSAAELVDSVLDATRRIATELRPGILDLGVVAAIEWQASEFQKRMEIPCQVACAERDIPLAPETSIALFRIFQEALTNIAKHAAASQVEVELEVNDSEVRLLVHDDGRGLPAGFSLEKSDRLGLQIVRTLVSAELDGSLGMHDVPGGGTDVVLRVPVGRRGRAAQ